MLNTWSRTENTFDVFTCGTPRLTSISWETTRAVRETCDGERVCTFLVIFAIEFVTAPIAVLFIGPWESVLRMDKISADDAAAVTDALNEQLAFRPARSDTTTFTMCFLPVSSGMPKQNTSAVTDCVKASRIRVALLSRNEPDLMTVGVAYDPR